MHNSFQMVPQIPIPESMPDFAQISAPTVDDIVKKPAPPEPPMMQRLADCLDRRHAARGSTDDVIQLILELDAMESRCKKFLAAEYATRIETLEAKRKALKELHRLAEDSVETAITDSGRLRSIQNSAAMDLARIGNELAAAKVKPIQRKYLWPHEQAGWDLKISKAQAARDAAATHNSELVMALTSALSAEGEAVKKLRELEEQLRQVDRELASARGEK